MSEKVTPVSILAQGRNTQVLGKMKQEKLILCR